MSPPQRALSSDVPAVTSDDDTLAGQAAFFREHGSGMLTQGGRAATRPPWPDDSIGFLPTYHWICMRSRRSGGNHLPTAPLAEWESSPQAWLRLPRAALRGARPERARRAGRHGARARRGGEARTRSHRRFVPPFIHFTPDSRTYSVPPFLKQQCDRTLGGTGAPPVRGACQQGSADTEWGGPGGVPLPPGAASPERPP